MLHWTGLETLLSCDYSFLSDFTLMYKKMETTKYDSSTCSREQILIKSDSCMLKCSVSFKRAISWFMLLLSNFYL